jgi:hypothetical protein
MSAAKRRREQNEENIALNRIGGIREAGIRHERQGSISLSQMNYLQWVNHHFGG